MTRTFFRFFTLAQSNPLFLSPAAVLPKPSASLFLAAPTNIDIIYLDGPSDPKIRQT